MTFKNLRYGLSSSVVLAASLFSVPSYAATDSIGLTVITTVEIGTCTATLVGNDSNLLIVFYVQIMPDDFVMQLHR
ncbi:hypothetical protein LXO11_21275, partial [Escherichia coli]|nr:hypothetical protein [Escherichia coli]